MTDEKASPKNEYYGRNSVQKAWDDGVLYDIAYATYYMHLSEVSQNLTSM